MKYKHFIFGILITAVMIIVLYNCKDRGIESPALLQLSATSTNVSVVKGTSVQITLSGGVLPYSIRSQPQGTQATISLASSVLTISGVDIGSTITIVVDSKTPIPDSLEIIISVLETAPLVSFSNQIQPVFNNQCTQCHGSNGGLSLTAGSSHHNLVNVQAQSSCPSLKRVLPNDAVNSVLYKKISGPSCGTKMPQGGTLNANDAILIRDWINQGAPNN